MSGPPEKRSLPPGICDPHDDPHDDRELEIGGLLRVGGIIVAVTLGAMGLMSVFRGALVGDERAHQAEPPPIASTLPAAPPEPRLQPHPSDGLADLRAKEATVLEQYRWVEPASGVVGVPIERGMELLLQKPPAVRDQTAAPREPPSSRPTQSSQGLPRGGER
ncbi:MAG: hypothetical protein WKG00_17965 [Polyangiaceae bacterium]